MTDLSNDNDPVNGSNSGGAGGENGDNQADVSPMSSDVVKIVFPLELGADHGVTRERLWVKRLSDGNL
jgi:hypothetical protein